MFVITIDDVSYSRKSKTKLLVGVIIDIKNIDLKKLNIDVVV